MTDNTQTEQKKENALEKIAGDFMADFRSLAENSPGRTITEPVCKILYLGLKRTRSIPENLDYEDILDYLIEQKRISRMAGAIPASLTGVNEDIAGYCLV